MNARQVSRDQNVNMKYRALRVHAKTLELARILVITLVMLVPAQQDSLAPTVNSVFHVFLAHVTTVLVSTTKTTKVTLVLVRSVSSVITVKHQFHATTINAKTTQHAQTRKI